jgi:hypothetical protein
VWIRDVDVPQVVLDAAEAGKLVFFVGAGASRARPSCLPDFEQLVRDIGLRAGRNPTDSEVSQPDVFLGRLEDSGVDVHQLVATAIDKPGSRPNPLHSAIVKLAAAYPMPRIVTTNYDRHLTSAAADLSIDLQVYEAPALPVGDDFEGIVHLHGSLNQPSRRLVVTDSDFGRAYLREAWAARFLERLFTTLTVVFIGYSHGDVVMQYLARSLGSDHTRYVLTDDAQNGEWRRLGLKTISYLNDSGDHSALPAALERWSELAMMGHVEHRARVADLMSGEPPTIPEDVSYIEATLSHPERIKYFEEKATFSDEDRSHRWFGWIEGRSAFQALFSQQMAGETTSRVLMSWIADQFIVSEGRSGIALRAFRERSWPPDTWYVVAHRLFAHKGVFPTWLSPWLQLTLQNAPSRRADLLDMMLANTDWSGNFDLALILFEDRTRPNLNRALDFGAASDTPRFEVDLSGEEHWLTEGWAKVFAPVLDQHTAELLGLTTEQIARVYRSLRGIDPDHTFDPISFSRSAIEPHDQDRHRDSIDVLIDAARDCIETALQNDPPLAERFLTTWAGSSDTILRRLSLHGWRVRTDRTADEKLLWLRQRGWLWDISLQHEVFHLLRDAFVTASEDVARWYVEAAAEGPASDGQTEVSSYRSFNLLGWLADSAPHLSIAAEAFDEARAANPEYIRREHPDFNRYGWSGVVQDALPLTAAELHELVAQNPGEALAGLRKFRTDSPVFEGPTWTGALRSLQACVTAYPADGGTVAQVLAAEDHEFRTSLIYAWDKATLDEALTEQALAIIAGWDPEEVRRPACAMLSNGGDPDHPTAWHRFERARQLASALWPTASIDGPIVSGADIVMDAINHPAGDLAEFWTKAVQWEWSENESNWDGLPQQLVTELDRLVSSTDRNGTLAQAFLASQLHFFFGADREWCQTRLIPLFDWTANEDRAAAAWQGFLTWGRWNEGLLQAGLLDGYIATASHADRLPDDLSRQLAGHLTSIAMYAPSDPATWLTRFIIEAPEDLRVGWAQEVRSALIDLGRDESTDQWDRWIDAYWAGRNQSVPLPFTPAEASATAGWVIGLSAVRALAVDRVLASPAGLSQDGGFLYRLEHLDLASEASDWARLLAHLLKNTRGQQWEVGYYLEKIVPQLRRGTPSPDLSELINEAMRLGVTSAADW